jgi:hypothetical protein
MLVATGRHARSRQTLPSIMCIGGREVIQQLLLVSSCNTRSVKCTRQQTALQEPPQEHPAKTTAAPWVWVAAVSEGSARLQFPTVRNCWELQC